MAEFVNCHHDKSIIQSVFLILDIFGQKLHFRQMKLDNVV